MKRKDLILAAAVLLLAAALLLFGRLQHAGAPTAVRITAKGESHEYPLNEDREISLLYEGRQNLVKIEGGEVYMKSADCPDGTCVGQGRLRDMSGQIVCLPNRVVVELVGGKETVDTVVY